MQVNLFMQKIKEIFFDVFSKIKSSFKHFSLTEKLIFGIVSFVFIFSIFSILNKLNQSFLVEKPTYGGSFTEGIIGSPRFINPVLATSNTDKDLCSLIYSGLLKATPQGELIPDLADSYKISEDGFVYTFILKDNLFFHDGHPLTTEDIEFTLKMTQHDVIKSPKRANWDGVEIKRIDDKEIQFILTQPYSPFLENLTLGILPKHIWNEISPEQFAFSRFNIQPVGSGPYYIQTVKENSSGILEKYSLRAFDRYSLGEPYITEIQIKLCPDEDTLLSRFKKHEIENVASVSPDKIASFLENEKTLQVLTTPLPRIFGVFFNQNEASVFANKEVRSALNQATDHKQIVEKILNNYGVIIDGPLPPNSKYYKITNHPEEKPEKNIEIAKTILQQNGWKLNEAGLWEKITRAETFSLNFSISTADTPELKAVANLLKNQWEKIGAKVDLKIFEIGDLNQNVIRPRQYESLLFGEVIGRDMDLFAFWHSSQRNDPGLNIAMYTNLTTDNLLEQIRTITDEESRQEKFEVFQTEIAEDKPAVFLYSPEFIYLISKKIKNVKIDQITIPSERYLDIHQWYIETNKIWKLFSNS